MAAFLSDDYQLYQAGIRVNYDSNVTQVLYEKKFMLSLWYKEYMLEKWLVGKGITTQAGKTEFECQEVI